MPPRHAVRDLDDEQFQFVVESILNGSTDLEISSAFSAEFGGAKLAKSSLGRWRKAAGNELAERYRLACYQARQLLADLKQEDADKYQVVIGNIEDRLLTATREAISKDPIKLLKLCLEEEKRRLKEREINLKEKALELEIEKTRQARVGAGPDKVLEYLFEFIGEDGTGLKWFRSNAKKFETFLIEKYAEAR